MTKMIPFALDERLSLCASMVRPGVRVADIGTDHAYLPVWLTRRGICPYAIAADVNPLPLRRACETIQKYRAGDLVEARLSDGLTGLSSEDAEDFIIAGMGGDLIAQIIGRVSWIRDPGKRLVLQPVKSAEELRAFLYENGFCVEKEAVAQAGGRYYPVIAGHFGGEGFSPDLARIYGGELLIQPSPHRREYLLQNAGRLTARANGLRRAGRNLDEAGLYSRAAEALMQAAQKED